jgi:DNA-binding transcriptional LysR family regulator
LPAFEFSAFERASEWAFSRNGETIDVDVRGRMTTDDPSTAVEACAAGYGLFQSLALGLDPWLRRGDLVPVLGDWSEELYPLYAYHPRAICRPPRFGPSLISSRRSRQEAPADIAAWLFTTWGVWLSTL